MSQSPRSQNPVVTQHATWQPRDIAYNPDFDNAILQLILDDPSAASAASPNNKNNNNNNKNNNGITILPDDSSEPPQPGVSVRLRDIDPTSLPTLNLQDLPLSLDDPRRIYASPIPGLRLSHPGGYLEGGPGAALDEHRVFARDLIARNAVSDARYLADVVRDRVAENLAVVGERMRRRSEALLHNARVEKEIKTLMDQREMEVNIETAMKEDARRRRETRDKKKTPAV